MTLLIQQNDIGEYIGEPATLDRRRRRLSTVVKRHRIKGRPHIVSVHRKGSALVPADRIARGRGKTSRAVRGVSQGKNMRG